MAAPYPYPANQAELNKDLEYVGMSDDEISYVKYETILQGATKPFDSVVQKEHINEYGVTAIPGLGAAGTGAVGALGNIGSNPFQDITDTGKALSTFFGLLTSPNFWIRVGEGVIGVVLIGVGINAMLKGATGSSPGGAVKGAVKTFALPELQARQATRRASSIGTARQNAQTAGAAQRANISVTTAGKKAYSSSYSREMGRRDARLTKIVVDS